MKIEYWKSKIALLLIPFAFYFELVDFYFALLFLIWSIQGIRRRIAFLLDDVSQSKSPVLFWTISAAWVVLSLLSLYYSEPVINYYYGY